MLRVEFFKVLILHRKLSMICLIRWVNISKYFENCSYVDMNAIGFTDLSHLILNVNVTVIFFFSSPKSAFYQKRYHISILLYFFW